MTYVPVMDATGSIVQLLDTSGNVVADFHYDAWGVRTASGPAAGACPFGFAGMLQDATTGLYYDNARWYSAPQGRFLTRDPAGESGGLNLYAYCGNDPVNQTDSSGLSPDDGNPWTLSLYGGDSNVALAPGRGGQFNLSPDPYASLVTPAMSKLGGSQCRTALRQSRFSPWTSAARLTCTSKSRTGGPSMPRAC